MLMQLAMIVRGAQLRLERWAWTASGGDATLRLLLQPLGSKTRCTKRACSQGSHLIGLMRVLSCDRWWAARGPVERSALFQQLARLQEASQRPLPRPADGSSPKPSFALAPRLQTLPRHLEAAYRDHSSSSRSFRHSQLAAAATARRSRCRPGSGQLGLSLEALV